MTGGRVEFFRLPLRMLINLAWDLNFDPAEQIPGAPKWLQPFEPAFDLVAKGTVDSTVNGGTRLYMEDYPLMVRSLLIERLQMKTHYENRPMDAATLMADKPKLKRASASTRSKCETSRSTAAREPAQGPPPMMVTCQNVTMAQFAERLQSMAPIYLRYPVENATGLSGAWNFSFQFSTVPPELAAASAPPAGSKNGRARAVAPESDAAADPVGGISLFNALKQQLGLKLEIRKRPEPVLVIDHIEEKPIEN
jgi:uncharacterized protein (TIGR03435 family)